MYFWNYVVPKLSLRYGSLEERRNACVFSTAKLSNPTTIINTGYNLFLFVLVFFGFTTSSSNKYILLSSSSLLCIFDSSSSSLSSSTSSSYHYAFHDLPLFTPYHILIHSDQILVIGFEI